MHLTLSHGQLEPTCPDIQFSLALCVCVCVYVFRTNLIRIATRYLFHNAIHVIVTTLHLFRPVGPIKYIYSRLTRRAFDQVALKSTTTRALPLLAPRRARDFLALFCLPCYSLVKDLCYLFWLLV